MGTSTTSKKPSAFDRFLSAFEKAANALPSPFTMFVMLFIIVALLSLVLSMLGVTAINPSTGKEVVINNFFSRSGIEWLMNNLITNFSGYAPLGLVLVMNLGIGMCEEVGLVKSFLRSSMANVPPALLTYAIAWVGCMGNLASDAATVIIPPLAGMLYLGVGKNPLVGFMLGRAGGSMGFHSNMLIAGTDALAQGITNSAIPIVSNNPDLLVDVVCNYYFMFTAVIVNTIACGLITELIIAPRFGEYTGKVQITNDPISDSEKKGLRSAGLMMLVYIGIVLAGVLPTNGILRTVDGQINGSPFLKGIIPLLFGLFLSAGLAYGFATGFIKTERDVPKILAKRTGTFNSYIVQVFAISQFTALFNWTNLGSIIAIEGADLLASAGFTGMPLVYSFMLMVGIVGIFVSSNSAEWAVMAPIFVPMFMMLGYNPAFVQLANRCGMQQWGAINPLSVYLYMVLGMMQEYDEKVTLGTILSNSVPYVIGSFVTWYGQITIWMLLDLPIGIGVHTHMMITGVPLMV